MAHFRGVQIREYILCIYIYTYIYIYIYILIFVPPRGDFMESGTQPTRPNFPCLLRILYEASTVDTECAPSMWPLVTPLAWEEP